MQDEIELTFWIQQLMSCDTKFENIEYIAPFELACIYNNATEEPMYCPYLDIINDNGHVTMMTFINPNIVDSCDFSFTAPAHWLEKIYNVEIQSLEDYKTFQSQSVMNYITILMNKRICYNEKFLLYHSIIAEEGSNKLIDELTCVYNYICQMVEESGETNIRKQLEISVKVVDTFFHHFEIPKQVEAVLMACNKTQTMRTEDKQELDMSVWGVLFDKEDNND